MAFQIETFIREGKEYYDEEIAACSAWEPFYHLSSLRRSALCWYPFSEGSAILEVGCGYGALTGVLCEKAGHVDAVDSDPQCARMTEKRYADRQNLHVEYADIRLFRNTRRYDYIVVMEFLEVYEGDIPGLFRRLKKMLLPEGTLLLGFRNRRGLKYSCGALDEYVHRAGEALDPGTPLHTKKEIAGCLRRAGFGPVNWYYPLPDFGFTQAVYSDEWLPAAGIRDRILTYDPFGEDSSVCAQREYALYDDAEQCHIPDTANVFLAECTAGPASDSSGRVIGAVLSADRERAHAFATVLYRGGEVRKKALYKEGGPELAAMKKRTEELQARGVGTVPCTSVPGELITPFQEKELMIDHIRQLLEEDPEKVPEIFDLLYMDICRSADHTDTCSPAFGRENRSPVLKEACIDMIPNNAFWDDGKILYFDQEFAFRNCPADYVLYRALRYTWLHIAGAEAVIPLEQMKSRYGLSDKWDLYTQYEDAFTERNRNRRLYAQLYRWAWTKKPYRTGMVMGTFDLFHTGHLNLLRRARQRCEFLRAGVLSDDLVFKYKQIRPAIPAKERLRIVEAVRYVDEAVLIEGEYVSKIEEWYKRPYDCFFSGDDYAEHDYWKKEKEELNQLGADIEFFPYTEEVSSTMLREKVNGQEAYDGSRN